MLDFFQIFDFSIPFSCLNFICTIYILEMLFIFHKFSFQVVSNQIIRLGMVRTRLSCGHRTKGS